MQWNARTFRQIYDDDANKPEENFIKFFSSLETERDKTML